MRRLHISDCLYLTTNQKWNWLQTKLEYSTQLPLDPIILGIQQASGSASAKEGYHWGTGKNVSEGKWCPGESSDTDGRMMKHFCS